LVIESLDNTILTLDFNSAFHFINIKNIKIFIF
jgi:hypothetical protein